MDRTPPSSFYTGLVAQLYRDLRGADPDPAIYAAFIRSTGEPALELGCGDGDPLLALRQEGLEVEGVDSSADAGATFNLLPTDEVATAALDAIARHLRPGGRALIPLFLPDPVPEAALGRSVEKRTDEATVVRCTTVASHRDEDARLQTTTLRYELEHDGGVEVLERDWTLHWHTQDGFAALARAAGLHVDAVVDPDGRPATAASATFVFVLSVDAPQVGTEDG